MSNPEARVAWEGPMDGMTCYRVRQGDHAHPGKGVGGQMTPDVRQCSRCGVQTSPGTALDPPHRCAHGVECGTDLLKKCPACYVARREEQRKREERR